MSLWLEDFSGVYELLQSWRSDGVTDIRRFLTDDPAAIGKYFREFRVLKVNPAPLDLYGAKDLDALLAAGDRIFRQPATRTRRSLKSASCGTGLCPIAPRPSTTHSMAAASTSGSTSTGWLMRPARWDRMLMAIEDFTAEKGRQAAASNEAMPGAV